jgi:hypothetical protein
MLNRDPQRESPRPVAAMGAGHAPHGLDNEGLSSFRRAYRWLNLTLVQHGLWPLAVVVWSAPAGSVPTTPLPWFWVRLAGPLLAAGLALAYLAQRPEGLPNDAAQRGAISRSERDRRLREQFTILVVGVTIAVGLLRVLEGPFVPVLKLEAFGLAQVVAYQAINFGVAGRSAAPGLGVALPILLFGLSWGLQELFLTAASPGPEDLVLSFAGGGVLGLVFGALSFGLRRWPGGFLTASALQFLLVYLVLGFLRP